MMKKVLRTVSCLAVLLMVVSILPSGALAAEDSVQDDGIIMNGKMNRFAESRMDFSEMKEKFQNNERVQKEKMFMNQNRMRVAQDIPVFESEEEKFEYFQTRIIRCIDRMIERLEITKENIDYIENEDITVEMLDSKISQLEGLKEDAENAETLEELKTGLCDLRECTGEMRRHFNMKCICDRPVFESEEERFDYLQTKLMESIDSRIERLEHLKENPDEIKNEDVTVEMIGIRIDKLEEAKEDVGNAESIEDLQGIRESIRLVSLKNLAEE